MMLLALAAAAIGPTPAEFFPLIKGTRLTYEENSVQRTITVDEVQAPKTISGIIVTPVITTVDGRTINTTYYRVDSTRIEIVATEPPPKPGQKPADSPTPLPMPLPVLELGSGASSKWSFYGPASADQQAEPLRMDGEARLKGERNVLGKTVPILEVRTNATVGGGRAQERVEQTAIYGKGIGLVELVSKTQVSRRSVTSTLRLVKIEPPKEGG